MAKKSIKAFTLLELIVVLVVLGILAALSIPTFAKVQTSSSYRVASSTSKSLARDANTISASAGRATTSTDIASAVLEVTAPANASVTSASGSAVIVTATGTNNAQTCYVYISGTSAATQGLATNNPGTTVC